MKYFASHHLCSLLNKEFKNTKYIYIIDGKNDTAKVYDTELLNADDLLLKTYEYIAPAITLSDMIEYITDEITFTTTNIGMILLEVAGTEYLLEKEGLLDYLARHLITKKYNTDNAEIKHI